MSRESEKALKAMHQFLEENDAEDMPMDEALKVASASARFNLKAATASGGAPEMSELLEYVKTCSFEEIPEYFR